ncbi:TetR/AcrR family transcriptional regulator [Aeromicrobium piscarium]|uniref:TetR family transcriptional regulator n=1 Tax=Aeromicrobium piscarium TaxID=2590901 RepID=A0A554S870_9ACTN|nr:TetR family transcriptional regulator [Aeromicrobium piscarium]TSD62515.1 TetR family transcriptional regulator [Aeromicrobium piscarium]
MRSTGPVEDADKTSRARLRDAAILCFARDGFGASVRSIATEAGVSAGLVIHHFGSKQALREACDSQVLAIIRETKQQSIREVTAGKSLLHRFAAADEQGPLLGYIVRSLQDGGPVAATFIEHLVADAVAYCADGVRAGLLHPSRDEPARARYLTLSAMGALLLEIQLRPPADPADLSALVREFMSTSYLPMLELYTQGVFTTSRLLDDYLLTVPDRSPAE